MDPEIVNLMKKKAARRKSRSRAVSYLDINQLELAFINRVLEDPRTRRQLPEFVDIGRSKRILLLQKKNLQTMLRDMDRERGKGMLEGELQAVLSGEKRLSISCFFFR